jgi:hypothetical protein
MPPDQAQALHGRTSSDRCLCSTEGSVWSSSRSCKQSPAPQPRERRRLASLGPPAYPCRPGEPEVTRPGRSASHSAVGASSRAVPRLSRAYAGIVTGAECDGGRTCASARGDVAGEQPARFLTRTLGWDSPPHREDAPARSLHPGGRRIAGSVRRLHNPTAQRQERIIGRAAWPGHDVAVWGSLLSVTDFAASIPHLRRTQAGASRWPPRLGRSTCSKANRRGCWCPGSFSAA